MSSAPTDCRVPATPDPADKLDAKADGNFGNHRAGYGDRLDSIITFARRGWSLPGPEGLVLVQEIDRLRGELELVSSEAADAYHAIDRRDDELAQQSITLTAEHQRAERILAKLREPSDAVVDAAFVAVIDWYPGAYNDRKSAEFSDEIISGLQAAVAAAEREVANDAG